MTAIIITCDPIVEDCSLPTPFDYDKSKYMFPFVIVSIISLINAWSPMIAWYSYRHGSLADFLPNQYLYTAWTAYWTGSLAIWLIPSFFWIFTFFNVKILDVIYSAWLLYIVSNVTPFHWLACTVLFVVAELSLTPVESSPGIKGVTNKEVVTTAIVTSLCGFAFWLFTFFFGKKAIMFVDYTMINELEWEEPGYMSPTMF